jgi:hypothetical protein
VGLFEGTQVFALEVLYERELELVSIRELPNDRGDPVETGKLGGAEASLAGDELVAVNRLDHEDRLQDAMGGNARSEGLELRLTDPLTGLARVRPDP